MIESILNSVKKRLGMSPEYDAFDEDIVMSINSALSTLTQIGVGADSGFRITGADEEWATFLGSDPGFDGVKDYVYLKTRMVFDPPTTSYMITAMEKQIAELEFRINAYYDRYPWTQPLPTPIP
jgi:hypothetical protein